MVKRRKKESKQEIYEKRKEVEISTYKVDEVYTVRNNLLQGMSTGKYRYVAVCKGKGNILRRLYNIFRRSLCI